MDQQPERQDVGAAVLEDDPLDPSVMAALTDALELDEPNDTDTTAFASFPLMPLGQACDMGHAGDGTPLFDARIMNSVEFQRNPYPYFRILRDHYPVFHDTLHNCYYVTRYDDITTCYFDGLGFNTIPKGSSNGVLGNTQLELSGIEHGRRRNLYGRHLVGAALTKRIHAIRSLATEMIDTWFDPASGVAEIDPVTGRAHDRAGPGLRQRVPDPGRVPGARLPGRGPRVVLLLVPLDDERARRPRDPPAGPGGSPGPRGLRRGHRRAAPEGADVPLRRAGQRDRDGRHLGALPLEDRRRHPLHRGDHVQHRARGRRRRRDHPRRHPEPLVPAAAAPRPARRRAGRPDACGTRRSTRRCGTRRRSAASRATTPSTSSSTG